MVPFSSEALLSFLIANGTLAYTAVLVATAGNWLGGMSSFAVGLGLLRASIPITVIAMLAGKFIRYVIWGWLTGLVF